MESISIRVAGESDSVDIMNFKSLYFHRSEPLELAHPEVGNIARNANYILQAIKNGIVLMASETSSNILVGILIADPIQPDEAEVLKLAASEVGEQRRADILNFLSYVEAKANICQRFNVPQSFHVHIVAVHPLYRGQRIASKLFESSIVIAKAKEFKLISVDCTSFYTTRIAESFAMDCISNVTYQEYNSFLGKCLFVPNPPHMAIKTFAKRLYSNWFHSLLAIRE